MTRSIRSIWIAAFLFGWIPLTIVIAVWTWNSAPHEGFVEELTVSSSVFLDQNKLRDVRILNWILVLGAVGAAFCWAAIVSSKRFITPGSNQVEYLETNSRLFLAAAFVFAWIALGGPIWGLAATLFATLTLTWRLGDEWSMAVLHAFVMACAGAVVANNALGVPVAQSLIASYAAACIAIAGLSRQKHIISYCYMVATIALCLVVASFAPVWWKPAIGVLVVSPLDMAYFGLAVSILLVVAARNFSESEQTAQRSLRPPAIIVMATALMVLSTPDYTNNAISIDDYHFGERLVAFDALANGNGLFTGLLPAHGFVDAIPGILGWLANEPTAAGQLWGEMIAITLVRLVLFSMIFLIFGTSIESLILSLFIPFSGLIITMSFAFIATIVATSRIQRPEIAGIVALILSAACVFTLGGIGVAVAVAAFAIALLYRWFRLGRDAILFIGGAGAAAAVFSIIAFSYIWVWLWYLQVSGKTNLTIYGASIWKSSLTAPWVTHHHIYMLLPLLTAALAIGAINSNASFRSGLVRLALLTFPIAAFALLINIYSMGRIDPGMARAVIGTLLCVFVFCVWGATLMPAPFRRVALSISIPVFAMSGYIFPFIPPASLSIMPTMNRLPTNSNEFDPAFRLGSGYINLSHARDIAELSQIINKLVPAGEPLGNVTNRSALSYYLGRPLQQPLTSAYNSAPIYFQEAVIREWRKQPPRVVIVKANNVEHDGYSLPLRSHLLYRYILEHYDPVEQSTRIFAVRKGQRDSVAKTPAMNEFFFPALSDRNWTNGVAIGENAKSWSFFLPQQFAQTIELGNVLLFSDGVRRTVLAKEGLNIKVSGSPLDPALLYRFKIENRVITVEPIDLWRITFPAIHLGKIPSAWGRSIKRLADDMLPDRQSLSLMGGNDLGLPEGQAAQQRVVGGDPFWIVQPAQAIRPQDFGLLEFEIECDVPLTAIPAKIYWRTAAKPFDEINSASFTISYATNLVPLDSFVDWLLSEDIVQLRIDVGSGRDVCPHMRLLHADLRQRKF